MHRKIMVFILLVALTVSLGGCFWLLAGAAGGAGTAVWLSGKLTQEFNFPYEQVVKATEKAFESLQLEITKKTEEEKVTQFRGKYSDGKEVWVDVRKVTEKSSKAEVRVGAVSSDKEAATKVLKSIQSFL